MQVNTGREPQKAGIDPDGAEAFVAECRESLGLPVVAEGIEEQLDVDFLSRLGCDMGQGWLLGRPMPDAQAALLMLPPIVNAEAA